MNVIPITTHLDGMALLLVADLRKLAMRFTLNRFVNERLPVLCAEDNV